MTGAVSKILSIVRREIRAEIRAKESLFAVFLFVALVLFIFNFSFGSAPETVRKLAAGVIWTVVAFSGTIALSHLSRRDREDRAGEGLLMAGCGGTTLFFARFLSSLLFLFAIEAAAVPLFALFFNFSIGPALPAFLAVLVAGTVGYAALGTLFASLLAHARLRDLLLPILFYPFIIPLLVAAVLATDKALAGEFPAELGFIAGFDLIFVSAAALLFEYTVEDPS